MAPLNLSLILSFSDSMLFVVVEDAPGSCCVTLVCPSGLEVTTVVVVACSRVSIAGMGMQRSDILTGGRSGNGLPLIIAIRLLTNGLPAVGRAAGVAACQTRRGAVCAIVRGIAGGVAGVGRGMRGGGFGKAGDAPFRFLVLGGVHGSEVEG